MTLVNTETGEIAKSPESVVEFLQNAKWMLDAAVEMTGPAEVALIKAQVAMAETYARELALSKDIQEQSREMVRRAEYALGRALRQGQVEGTVAKPGDIGNGSGLLNGGTRSTGSGDLVKPRDMFTNNEEWTSAYLMADAGSETFEQALEEAKAEGNLSRANVVRKIKGQNESAPVTRRQRADVIADLAGQGYSSHQMADRVGVTPERVREIARSFDIAIPADKAVGRQVRINHTAAVESAVTSLDHWASSLSFIDFAEVDGTEADEWVASLNHSLTELRRFIKQIKETTHV